MIAKEAMEESIRCFILRLFLELYDRNLKIDLPYNQIILCDLFVSGLARVYTLTYIINSSGKINTEMYFTLS